MSDLPAPAVHALLTSMYEAYLRGDRSVIDALLLDDVTIFDSAGGPVVSGLGELAELRAKRPTGDDGPTETALTISDLKAREVGDMIIATWHLRVDARDASGADLPPELCRNSAVFVRDGGLRIAHLHEQVEPPVTAA